jgi:hypothetical protein
MAPAAAAQQEMFKIGRRSRPESRARRTEIHSAASTPNEYGPIRTGHQP